MAAGETHWHVRGIDIVLGIAALLVSAISLWVAIGTEDANRQVVTASSWPFLQVQINNSTTDGKPEIQMNVVNAGVGPAKIETFEVFWKGRPYRSSSELLQACCGIAPARAPMKFGGDSHTHALRGTEQGIVLRAGETQSFVIYPLGPDNEKMWNALDRESRTMTYRICYCSVFDECWRNTFAGTIYTAAQLHPPRVAQCPVPRVAFEE